MAYSWRVYRAMWDDELKGYIYAQNEAEARQAWQHAEGTTANTFVEVEDLEYYLSSPEEGGYLIFLAPDELVDHYVEPDDINTAHVFFMHGVDDEP